MEEHFITAASTQDRLSRSATVRQKDRGHNALAPNFDSTKQRHLKVHKLLAWVPDDDTQLNGAYEVLWRVVGTTSGAGRIQR